MLLPGGYDLPEAGKFSSMISVVVSHDQDFGEDGAIWSMGIRGIQVILGVIIYRTQAT